MTRPWWVHSYKRLSKGEVGQLATTVDQRNLTALRGDAEGAIEQVRGVRWSPWLFDHLGQPSHCWCIGRGQRASWPALPSPRRTPRRSWRRVCKTRWQTSPRRSGGNKSAVRSVWRLPKTILRKDKNTKWPIYNCFFIIVVFWVLYKHTVYVTICKLSDSQECGKPTWNISAIARYCHN